MHQVKKYLLITTAIFYVPWNTVAVDLNLIHKLLCLTLFLIVNLTILLVVRKPIEAVRACHTFQGVHFICTRSICSLLCKCVYVYPEALLLVSFSLNISCSEICLKWVGIHEEEESISFAFFGWFSLVVLCNVKGVAKLAFKDGWLELVT